MKSQVKSTAEVDVIGSVGITLSMEIKFIMEVM
jgi:hypothetical protein